MDSRGLLAFHEFIHTRHVYTCAHTCTHICTLADKLTSYSVHKLMSGTLAKGEGCCICSIGTVYIYIYIIPAVLCVYKHLASYVRSSFTLTKTQDWVETSVFFDNNICPTISASGVSLSIIIIYVYNTL